MQHAGAIGPVGVVVVHHYLETSVRSRQRISLGLTVIQPLIFE
jgi:hypothetical protein